MELNGDIDVFNEGSQVGKFEATDGGRECSRVRKSEGPVVGTIDGIVGLVVGFNDGSRLGLLKGLDVAW